MKHIDKSKKKLACLNEIHCCCAECAEILVSGGLSPADTVT